MRCSRSFHRRHLNTHSPVFPLHHPYTRQIFHHPVRSRCTHLLRRMARHHRHDLESGRLACPDPRGTVLEHQHAAVSRCGAGGHLDSGQSQLVTSRMGLTLLHILGRHEVPRAREPKMRNPALDQHCRKSSVTSHHHTTPHHTIRTRGRRSHNRPWHARFLGPEGCQQLSCPRNLHRIIAISCGDLSFPRLHNYLDQQNSPSSTRGRQPHTLPCGHLRLHHPQYIKTSHPVTGLQDRRRVDVEFLGDPANLHQRQST